MDRDKNIIFGRCILLVKEVYGIKYCGKLILYRYIYLKNGNC